MKGQRLNIPDPCTQSWEGMTPTEKGAFCTACAKEVIDFTVLDTFKIKSILGHKSLKKEPFCGRIKSSQLNHYNQAVIQFKNEEERNQFIWVFSIFCVFGLSLFSCSSHPLKEIMHQAHIESKAFLKEHNEPNQATSIPQDDTFLDKDTSETGENTNTEVVEKQLTLKIESFEPKIDLTEICFIGDIVISGGFVPIQNDAPRSALFFNSFFETDASTRYPVNSREFETVNQPVAFNTTDLYKNGNKYFEAYLHPLPFSKDTQLYLNFDFAITLKIDLYSTEEKHHLIEFDFQQGEYQIPFLIEQLTAGKYTLQFDSNKDIIHQINFEIQFRY